MLRIKCWHLVLKIILLLYLLVSFGCVQKTQIQTPPPPGTGSGDFEFNIVSVPSSFNCNYNGNFKIYLAPNIDTSYAGFNRIWFELEKYGLIYRSNYVEFYSNDASTKELEWGGSLLTGDYTMKGYLKNIQLNSSCEDKVCKEYGYGLGNISVAQYAPIQQK